MRDQLSNENAAAAIGVNMDANIGNNLNGNIGAFISSNQPLDARRRLEDALEEKRLCKEIQEFEFDLDDFED